MILHNTDPKIARVRPTTQEFLSEHSVPNLAEQLSSVPMAPPQFSLKSGMSDVENQGMGETCCSFAVTAALEYVSNRLDLSEANLADVGGRTYHNCDPKAGLGLGEAMTICQQQGLVLATDWPYDPNKVCWNPPPNVGNRPHYKFSQIGTVFQRPLAEVFDIMRATIERRETLTRPRMPGNFVALTKSCLVNVKVPVVLDVPVWFNSSGKFDAGWDLGPDIHMPTPHQLKLWLERCAKDSPTDPPGIDGWHAIPICGFDDTTARFEFKNSWGWWWGNAGYGTIPYDYITQYSRSGMVGH